MLFEYELMQKPNDEYKQNLVNSLIDGYYHVLTDLFY